MFKSVKSSKKILAILLSIAMVCSVFSFCCVNVMAGTEPTVSSEELPAFNKSEGAEITLADGGVWMEGGETDWVSQTLEVGAKPVIAMMPVIEIGESANVAITADSITKNGVVDYSDAKGLILNLTRTDETTLVISYYKSATDEFVECLTKNDYDPTKTFRLSWERMQRKTGSEITSLEYEVTINDSLPETIVSVSNRVYELDDENFFTFFAEGNANGFTFKNTRIDSDAGDDFTGIRSPGHIEITGNVEDGCNFTNISTVAPNGGLDTLLTYNRAFDFDNIEFTFTVPTAKDKNNAMIFIAVSSFAGLRCNGTFDGVDVNNPTGDTLYFGFSRYNGTHTIIYKDSGGDKTQIGTNPADSTTYDPTTEHTVNFKKVGNDYYMYVNGTQCRDAITDYVKNLVGKKVFVTVATPGYYTSVKNFRIRSNSSATSAEEQPTGLTSNEASAVIGGNEINGYTATGTATGQTNGTFVNLVSPIDINTEAIRYGNSNLVSGISWAQIAISNSPNSPSSIYAGSTDSAYNMVRINIRYNSWGADYRLYNTSGEIKYAYSAFNNILNPGTSDLISFKKDETDGKWDMYCNGAKVSASDAYTTARDAMSPVLDELAKGKAYVHFTNFNKSSAYFDIKTESNYFQYNNNAVISSNYYYGYTATAETKNTTVKMRLPMNVKKEAVNLKLDNTGGWKMLSLSSSSNTDLFANPWSISDPQNNHNLVNIRLQPKTASNELQVYAFYANSTGGTEPNELLGTISDFDFTVAHKFGFYKVKDNWRIVIDGVIPEFTYSDAYQTVLNTNLNNLSLTGKAYLQLYSCESATGFSKIKYVNANYSFPKEYTFDKSFVSRTYDSLKVSSVADGVKINFYSDNRCIYSNDIGEGLDFKIWNQQKLYAKLVYADGSTALTRIYSAGDVTELGKVDIRSLVAMDNLAKTNSTTYNSDINGDNVTDDRDLKELKTMVLNNSVLNLESSKLDPIMQYIFAGNKVENETVMFIDKGDAKSLLYTPDKILSVTSYDGSVIYTEGEDYKFENGKLIALSDKIPTITSAKYYNNTESSYLTMNHDGKEVNVYWGEGRVMTDYQVNVTYTHSDTWEGFKQPSMSAQLNDFINKLRNGEDVTIMFYGDSITAGASASAVCNCAPYQERYSVLFTRALADLFCYNIKYVNAKAELTNIYGSPTDETRDGASGTITYINTAVPGWATNAGLTNYDKYIRPYIDKYGCDLFVVAFGMNDGTQSAETVANLEKQITDKVLSQAMDTSLIFMATMVPNPKALNNWNGSQREQEAAIKNVVAEYVSKGVPAVTCCMTSTSLSVLEHKEFQDYSGNNINHPNDFFVRVYAQTLLQTVIGYENIK